MNLVKLLIVSTGLTQKEFAKKVGDPPTRISEYATGKVQIPLNKYQEWCNTFGYNIEDLFV